MQALKLWALKCINFKIATKEFQGAFNLLWIIFRDILILKEACIHFVLKTRNWGFRILEIVVTISNFIYKERWTSRCEYYNFSFFIISGFELSEREEYYYFPPIFAFALFIDSMFEISLYLATDSFLSPALILNSFP